MSIIGGGTTPVVWTRTVNMWFDKGRGLALGLALAGSGLAGIFAPLLTTMAIRTWGWQGGYLALGGFILLVAVPIIFVFYSERPSTTVAASPAPGTTPATGGDVQPVELGGYTLAEAVRSTAFWKIAIGFFFVSGVVAGLIINLVPLLIDRGLTPVDAASVAGVMGIAVLCGRVGIGFLLDRFHPPAVARTLLALCAIGCFLLTIPGAPRGLVLLSVVSLGLAAAAEVDLVAYLTSRFCGMRAYGRIYGFQLTAFYAGAAVGPLVAGIAYDRFQSYVPMLYTATGALLFGAIVTGTLGRPPQFATTTAAAAH
jgi:cyanate permease